MESNKWNVSSFNFTETNLNEEIFTNGDELGYENYDENRFIFKGEIIDKFTNIKY